MGNCYRRKKEGKLDDTTISKSYIKYRLGVRLYKSSAETLLYSICRSNNIDTNIFIDEKLTTNSYTVFVICTDYKSIERITNNLNSLLIKNEILT
jgi:hypothetical protein